MGPGLVLDGGADEESVIAWIHRTCAGGIVDRGDVVVLTAQPIDFSDGWLERAPFNSAQTISISPHASDEDLELAAGIVERAEVVWFTGGDQADYVEWMNTPLMFAVQAVYDRGGIVGGWSAGLIILGESVNDALEAVSETLTTPRCVADPYDPGIHITRRILAFPPLNRAITDAHFVSNDRLGRLATFMGREVADGFAAPDILGIGVEDGAALVIDRDGKGRRLGAGDASIFIIRGGRPQQIEPGAPLIFLGLEVLKLRDAEHFYDFATRTGRGFSKTVDIDGSRSPPYPSDVYDDGVLLSVL